MVEQKEMDSNSGTTKARRQAGRSPSYPGADLKTAIEKAKLIYKHENKFEADDDSIFRSMGYAGRSGASAAVLAALKNFGLLDTNKANGKMKLSPLALRIVLDEREDPTERYRAVQEAALKPPMHQKLWSEYGSHLPSDSSLMYRLKIEEQFTDAGAQAFMGEYKATMAFARLLGDDAVVYVAESDPPSTSEGRGGGTLGEAAVPGVSVPKPPLLTFFGGPVPPNTGAHPPYVNPGPPPGMRDVPIPIQGQEWPVIRAAFPLTESAWTGMLAVLTAMKPGLVVPDPKPAETAAPAPANDENPEE
jgi:hypothetical protein